jgi:16S rRNA (cytosine967-C5)-methyltransferase
VTPAARLAAAIDLLGAIEAAGRRPADGVANDFFRARRYIGGGDRRAIGERVWGVLRRRLRLGWWLGQVDARPTPRMLVAADLLLAEGLDLSDVLRAFPGGQYAPEPLSAPEERLLRALATRRGGGKGLDHHNMPEAARLEVPEWALPAFRARFGPRLPEEAAAMALPAPLDLRANLLKTTRDGAAAALAAEGIATEPTPFSPCGLRVGERRPVTSTRAFGEGLVEVQDEGSQLIALLTDARPGMRVADVCAGAGGKTLALAAAMGNRGRLSACDVSASKLAGAGRRFRRAGVNNAERHLFEPGDRWAKRRAGAFDRVLVDAPCTGTGTWRRNPDARTRTGPEDLRELLPKQAAILDAAAGLLRPGGRLVYATCSLLPEEDEAQVRSFLDRDGRFDLLPLAAAWAEAGMSEPPPGGGEFLLTSPARHGTDGFFAAILQRGACPTGRRTGERERAA